MTTVRTPKASDRRGFSMPRSTAQDGKRDGGLSFEARGVLAYLLSKPDDWKVQISDIMADGGIGRDKTKKILSELRKRGYLQTEMVSENGRFTGKIDRIFEVSQEVAITEKPKNRDTEKPSDGKTVRRKIHPLHNTDKIQNTEKDSAAGKAPAGRPFQKSTYAETSGKTDAELEAERAAVEAEMFATDELRYHRNEQRALLTQAITHVFKASGAYAAKFLAMLEGRQTMTGKRDTQWNEAAADLKGAPVTADELIEWSEWYRRTTLGGSKDATITTSPVKIASSILARRSLNSTPVYGRNGSNRRDPDKFLGGMDDTYWDTYTGPEPSRHE